MHSVELGSSQHPNAGLGAEAGCQGGDQVHMAEEEPLSTGLELDALGAAWQRDAEPGCRVLNSS